MKLTFKPSPWFINLVENSNSGKLNVIGTISERQDVLKQLVIDASSVYVKPLYGWSFFNGGYYILLIVTQKALVFSPLGRKMRALRDNEEAASAMGKNVVKEHLLIFYFRICSCWLSRSHDGYK